MSLEIQHDDAGTQGTRRRTDARTRSQKRSPIASLHPRVPVSAPLDIFATSIPARAFTGDFYRFGETPDGVWLVIGDVAGKGLHAAVFMAMIQEELERITSYKADLCDKVRSINRFLREHMPSNRFATMTIAAIGHDGVLRIANAGHPPALIRRANGAVERISSNGPALAMFEQACWKPATSSLAPGDTLILYTDGLTEAASELGEEFGVDRIVGTIENTAGLSSRAFGDAILAAVRLFGQFSDDVTVLAARVPTTYIAA